MMLCGEPEVHRPLATIIPHDSLAEEEAWRIAMLLRSEGEYADLAYRGNEKRRFELAQKANPECRLLIRGSEFPIPVRINAKDSAGLADTAAEDRVIRLLEKGYRVQRTERSQGLSYPLDAVLLGRL
jgi:histidyl-tRNA synthetase